MKIAVVGTGYVGLVTGTCFAESGHEVRCLDVDERKIQVLCVEKGSMPRPHFIKVFPGSETSHRWIKNEIAAARSYSNQLARYEPDILEEITKLGEIQRKIGIPLKDLKEINRQMSTGER